MQATRVVEVMDIVIDNLCKSSNRLLRFVNQGNMGFTVCKNITNLPLNLFTLFKSNVLMFL